MMKMVSVLPLALLICAAVSAEDFPRGREIGAPLFTGTGEGLAFALPDQEEGRLFLAADSSSSRDSRRSVSSRDSLVNPGFTIHLNVYAQGWQKNFISLGMPLQLGMELELPPVTMDFLGEASAGVGYGNLFEYRFGGMAEFYFFKKFGIGAGGGFYGNAMSMFIIVSDSGDNVLHYEYPGKTNYYRFTLIFREKYKTSLYTELYGDGKWGFGLMWGRVLTGPSPVIASDLPVIASERQIAERSNPPRASPSIL
jgi:hypothetical protein